MGFRGRIYYTVYINMCMYVCIYRFIYIYTYIYIYIYGMKGGHYGSGARPGGLALHDRDL